MYLCWYHIQWLYWLRARATVSLYAPLFVLSTAVIVGQRPGDRHSDLYWVCGGVADRHIQITKRRFFSGGYRSYSTGNGKVSWSIWQGKHLGNNFYFSVASPRLIISKQYLCVFPTFTGLLRSNDSPVFFTVYQEPLSCNTFLCTFSFHSSALM